ncbi:3-phosphoserine/phosphohydroxythreonine transaminase [Aquabacterium sp. J223]|uniref:3-phosphoserine/phosphohydroxythreonine transaminase n=1 Tax=Aquabacterium sp. J223 TaxID=2898431 RepID=UPI0021ADA135|nr:3-phosphoserine/phosphohydroxythreonine transaminase [Aquabacterium sp. J223]UUX97524.1 3-phosphoserine/phosphohydroxythreonine transaminase [Aquabacterium sp. J223]
MTRPYNFSPGPAALPEAVLQRCAAEMLDWRGSGMGVMEMSHRGKEFLAIHAAAKQHIRDLLQVPDDVHILFLQGGALAENAIVPMNLSQGGEVDVVVTGSWSVKSRAEARCYADVHTAASNEADGHTTLPPAATWRLREGAAYVHVCSNETIHGVEMHELPDLKALGCDAPLVADISSHMASRPIDWSRLGLAFGGAQKNVGPAGVTLVFVRDHLLGRALDICPSAFDFKTVAANDSMFNTPPTWAIYVTGLVFEWLHGVEYAGLRGLAAVERRNADKAALLYRFIDGSGGFYRNPVAADARSRMNVPFFLQDERLNEPFLAEAKSRGLLQLKGHKSVGGMRASLYNAMPLEGVQALVDHMKDFAARHG